MKNEMKTKEEALKDYHDFIDDALKHGFTPSQADWLWEKLSTFHDNIYMDK